jgi:Lrp/AsnC family leucine-responsive transcriptional regulator
MPSLTLDKTDLRILSELQLNGRLTNVELAERVALAFPLSETPQATGGIRRHSPVCRTAGSGQNRPWFAGLCRVVLEKRGNTHVQSFIDAVQRWPEVINCFAMTGEMDYLLQVYFEDLEHFSRFVMDELLQQQGVEDVKSSFVLKEIKRTTSLPLSQLRSI